MQFQRKPSGRLGINPIKDVLRGFIRDGPNHGGIISNIDITVKCRLSDGEILAFGVVDDDGTGGLLGDHHEGFRQVDADCLLTRLSQNRLFLMVYALSFPEVVILL